MSLNNCTSFFRFWFFVARFSFFLDKMIRVSMMKNNFSIHSYIFGRPCRNSNKVVTIALIRYWRPCRNSNKAVTIALISYQTWSNLDKFRIKRLIRWRVKMESRALQRIYGDDWEALKKKKNSKNSLHKYSIFSLG